jgi:hypothetical protein
VLLNVLPNLLLNVLLNLLLNVGQASACGGLQPAQTIPSFVSLSMNAAN